mgnify:CR=1 FL=1
MLLLVMQTIVLQQLSFFLELDILPISKPMSCRPFYQTGANNNLSQLIIRITVLSLVLCKKQKYIDWRFKFRII